MRNKYYFENGHGKQLCLEGDWWKVSGPGHPRTLKPCHRNVLSETPVHWWQKTQECDICYEGGDISSNYGEVILHYEPKTDFGIIFVQWHEEIQDEKFISI